MTMATKEVTLEAQIAALVEWANHPDPLERATRCTRLLDAFNVQAAAVSNMRLEAVQYVTRPGPDGWGWSQKRLADSLGITRSRVNQMLLGR